MEEPRIIKKYPNRRLYDTEISRYITLDEVKELVLRRVVFKVIEDRTEEDMTNYVLMQILAQEENGASPLFTREVLKSLICFYGNPLQKTVSQFLEKGLSLFTDPEADLQAYFQQFVAQDPSLNKIATDARQSIQMWNSVLEKFLAKNSAASPADNTDTPPPPK